jgi:hypothetical protein
MRWKAQLTTADASGELAEWLPTDASVGQLIAQRSERSDCVGCCFVASVIIEVERALAATDWIKREVGLTSIVDSDNRFFGIEERGP